MDKSNCLLPSIIISLVLTVSTQSSIVPSASANQISGINCSSNNARGNTLQEIGDRQYRIYLISAQQSLRTMEPNKAISFPLGLTCPIKLDAPSQGALSREDRRLYAIGYLDVAGNIQPIVPKDLIKIFGQHIQSFNQANRFNIELTNTTIPVDAPSGSQGNNQTVPALNLIVLDTRDNQPYFVPDVRFSTVFMDALNAALTKKITKSLYNLNALAIDELIRLPITEIQEI